MAPSKPKQTVSTSGMFKTQALKNSKPFKTPEPPQTSTKKPSKPQKPSKPALPADPIVAELNESLSTTAAHLRATTTSSIEAAHSTLLTHLVSASETGEANAKAEEEISGFLTRPLGEEILDYSQGGEQGPKATLDERMAKYGRGLDRAEGRLERLMGEMGRVEGEIEGCWGELQGLTEGMGLAVEGKSGEGKDRGKGKGKEGGGAGPGAAALRQKWEGKIAEMVKEKMEHMKAAEKEFNVREKRKSADLAKALGAES